MINYIKGVKNVTNFFLTAGASIRGTREVTRRYLYVAMMAILLMSIMVSGCGKSEQEMKDEYVKSAVQADYNDVMRNPDSFKGKVLTFTGEVSFVQENKENVELMVIVGREGVNGLPVWVKYTKKANEERILEGDTIKVLIDPYLIKDNKGPLAYHLTYIKKPNKFTKDNDVDFTKDTIFELSDSMAEELINEAILMSTKIIESSRLTPEVQLRSLES